jgi:pellino protein
MDASTEVTVCVEGWGFGNDGDRVFIFPACGHVHGFHAALINRYADTLFKQVKFVLAYCVRSCPLCRMNGPFVPLSYSSDSAICMEEPTHVFNPCGCVASMTVAEHWASVQFPPGLTTEQGDGQARCPFCAA